MIILRKWGLRVVKQIKITEVVVTTVAVPMRGRLCHSDGIEPPYQIRHLLEVQTDAGVTGLGEVGPRVGYAQLMDAAKKVRGANPFNLEQLRLALQSEKFYRMDLAMMSAAFQMAALDIQGKVLGLTVSDLLGGRIREQVDLIGYLFRLESLDSQPAVRTTREVVDHARRLVEHHGFRTIKFKAGAAVPSDDVEVMEALRAEFPTMALRVDPNAAWSVSTAINVGHQLENLHLEWIEDPTLGISGMAEFNRRINIPTATNMCCIQPRDFPAAVSAHAVNVVLLDLWYLGGPWSAKQMAAICAPFGIGVGIHSGGGSCELGVGLSAQLHLAASLPGLVYAADAEYHHLVDDVIVGGPFKYEGGAVKVPNSPGLGVELDHDKCAQYHELYNEILAHGTSENEKFFYPKW